MTTTTTKKPAQINGASIPPERAEAIQKKTAAVVKYAQSLVIKDDDGLKIAEEQYRKLGEYVDTIEPEFAKPKNLMHKAWMAMSELYNKAVTPATSARKMIGQKIVDYKRAVERKAEEARAAAQAEADKKSAAVAKGLETKAEKAAEAGDVTTAERLRESAQNVNVAPKLEDIPAVPTISTRKTWYAEVTDIKLLCRAVYEGVAPVEAVEPATSFLNRKAVERKEAGSQYPGVAFKQKESFNG